MTNVGGIILDVHYNLKIVNYLDSLAVCGIQEKTSEGWERGLISSFI